MCVCIKLKERMEGEEPRACKGENRNIQLEPLGTYSGYRRDDFPLAYGMPMLLIRAIGAAFMCGSAKKTFLCQ